MNLNPASSLPLYSQLEQHLRAQIVNRELEPGVQLPTERELCETFQVSRITVRRAIDDLSRDNLVYSIPGKGTFVSMSQMKEPLSPLSSFSEDMRRRGLQPYSIILQAEITPAEEALARSLSIKPGVEVVHLKRLRKVFPNNVAVAIQSACLPHFRCPNLLRFNLEKRSLYDVLHSEYNLILDRGETTLFARLASPDEGDQLGIKLPAAVLVSKQVTYLKNGEVIEMVDSVFRSDIYQLTILK
jgi:GntR family transcriptional regulator